MRLTGRMPDGGLTKAGRAQAMAAARQLAAPPSAIYASPRARTQETAGIVAELFGLDVLTAEALDEIDFGAWSGRTFAELDPDPEWQEWNAHRASACPPGGEPMARAQARSLVFAFDAAVRHQRPPLLVTHCDIIRSLHCWAQRTSLDLIHSFDCQPGSLSRLELASDERAAA